MVIYNSWLVPNGYVGITLWPFIFLSGSKRGIIEKKGTKYLNTLINHEKIHLRQQAELLIIPFYIAYIIDWVATGFTYKDIVFEREANANEDDMDYLKGREFWNWINYFKK